MAHQAAENSVAALTIQGLSKAFPGVRALDDVGFSVRPGEVHALVGENGAGKSTLLKILSGVYQADSGDIAIAGKSVKLSSPKAARLAGIAMIHQELQQVPELDVVQNMFLGVAPTHMGVIINRAAAQKKARDVLAMLDPTIDVTAKIRDLRVAQRQIIEIAKALLSEAAVIAMDEPTSSLTPREFEKLAEIIETLRLRGVAIIYVSHKFEEIYRVATSATVLRDGRKVGEVDLAITKERELVGMMVGRELEAHPHESHVKDEVVLEVKNLSRGDAVRDASFALHRGEVLCIAGLVGSGRTELVKLIAGVDQPTSGSVTVRGETSQFHSPGDAIAKGVALLPEERKKEGIIPLRSIVSNVSLPRLGLFSRLGLIKQKQVRDTVDRLTESVSLRPADIDREIRLFSGGNQQKAIICRWIMAGSEILIFDEPTRGIDVGAKGEIYRLINGLAAEGRAIIVVSSELPEILRLADRVLVMRRGMIEATLERAGLSEEVIMQNAISGKQNEAQPA